MVQELEEAHQTARRLAAATAEKDSDTIEGTVTADATPEEVAEFERLRNSVNALWEQLDMPPEDIVAFLRCGGVLMVC